MAEEMGIRFLGRIPVDPRVVAAGDAGKPAMAAYPESVTARAFEELVRNVVAATEEMWREVEEGRYMRVAVPVSGTNLARDPLAADLFAVYDIEAGKIRVKDVVRRPEEQDLEAFLKEQVATHLLALDLSPEWKERLEAARIRVVLGGAPDMGPDTLVRDFLSGILK